MTENVHTYRLKVSIITWTVVVAFVTGAAFYWFYTVEDAFINFRYSENLLKGQGLVFNSGDRVEGYTNFLWIIVLTLSRLFFPFPLAAKIPGLVFGVLLIFILTKMSRTDSGDRYSGLLAACLVAVCPGFQVWAVAGLETVFFSFLIISAVYFHESKHWASRYLSGVMFGMATLTRPEGALFFSLFILSFWLTNKNSRVLAIQYIAGFLIVVLPHILFRILYYNAVIPNTYWVKGHRFQGGGLAYFKRYAAMTGVFMLPVALLGLLKKHLFQSVFPLLLMASGYLLYVYRIGGDWMPYGRFLLPAIPLIALGAGRVCMSSSRILFCPTLSDQSQNTSLFSKALVLLIVASIVVSAVSAGYDLIRWRPTRYLGILKWESKHMRDWKKAAEWLAQHYPEDTYISTGLAGVIPYYTGFRTLDRGGLNDREIARIIYTSDSLEEEKRLVEQVVMNRQPDIVMVESLSFSMLRESPVISNDVLSDNPDFLFIYDLQTTVVDDRYFSFYALRRPTLEGRK